VIFNDLRHFIAKLEELGELKKIEGASCDLEIGAITELASFRKRCPAVLFDSIKGHKKGYRVLTNFLSNRLRERMVFGVSNDLTDPEAVLLWKNKLKEYKAIEPVEVKSGPVKENVLLESEVDLSQLPWPKVTRA
jgi:4-hydroxy-3-polyprenylbenzoate decarboxylase